AGRRAVGSSLDVGCDYAGAPSMEPSPSDGSQFSLLGMYQFQRPRSFIEAGSTTPRISVASISTAAARPIPNSCRSTREGGAKIANTATTTAAAAVTTPAELRMPCSTAAVFE